MLTLRNRLWTRFQARISSSLSLTLQRCWAFPSPGSTSAREDNLNFAALSLSLLRASALYAAAGFTLGTRRFSICLRTEGRLEPENFGNVQALKAGRH